MLDDGYIAMKMNWSGLLNSSVELLRVMKTISLEIKLYINETAVFIHKSEIIMKTEATVVPWTESKVTYWQAEITKTPTSVISNSSKICGLLLKSMKEPNPLCENGTVNISVVSECQSCQFNRTLFAIRSFEKFCILKKSYPRMNDTFEFEKNYLIWNPDFMIGFYQ